MAKKSNKPEHTPGPWMVAGAIGYGIMISSDSAHIAVVYGSGVTKEAQANACLIAKSPKLLLACKLAMRLISDKTIRDFMEDAVEEAEGRRLT